jgi:hypothetical protein
MALAAGCGFLGRRSTTGSRALIPLAVLGTLFSAWFGIVAVVSDASTTPHCAG